MQTTGNFISIRVKLAAGMQFSHYDFGSGSFLFLHHVHGNAAAVVDYSNGVIDVDVDFNRVAISGQGFVDRIVDDFIDQMMQS